MTLWGGRFDGSLAPSLWEFTADPADRRLLEVDVEGSIAHATVLGESGVIDADDADRIVEGLETILEEARAGNFEFVGSDEDVHTAVERRLRELIGEVAGRLHTGRSRNDQVALDLRLYLRRSGEGQASRLRRFVLLLADLAEAEAETVVPSYTHLQQAQPTTLGHHFLAHAWAALRDAERFSSTVVRLSVSPLGAGASAGSSLPLDPEAVAAALGLDGVMPNSLDAVASRDFVAEYVFCCAQAMVNLSRLAEELILWSTREFGWVTMGDEVSTGSSALPQKRNPDVAELVRGRSAGVIGDLTAILVLQKALPLAYNRDLQEDKGVVFRADDTLAASVEALGEMLRGVSFHPPPPAAETVALDLAEILVARGVPFREAHRKVGELVARLEAEGRTLDGATVEDLNAVAEEFEEEDLARLDLATSVRARVTPGSGGPASVHAQVAEIRRRVAG
ncbi:MAG: argininosuccinate lyase [Acidimicrobiia bacterium]